MIDVDAAVSFLDFVHARHEAWLNREEGRPQPWTDDPIVAGKKFTNVFRVLDYGSQFVLTDLLGDDPEPIDYLVRCFLYRHTGRVEAWQYLPLALGDYPTVRTLDDTLEAWKEYRGRTKIHKKSARKPGQKGRGNGSQKQIGELPVFTGAYLVFPQSQERGTDKLESIVNLTKRLVDNGSFADFLSADTQAERFGALRRNKGVADFMSMQTLTDFGYSTEFREDDFVVAGPGAKRGAAFLGLSPEQAIDWAWEALRGTEEAQPRLGGRQLSKMDVQNCLCEFSKYVRFASRPAPEQPYSPAHPELRSFVLPKHW